MKNILIIKGGGGTEHDISLSSADFIKKKLDTTKFKIFMIEIDRNSNWLYNGAPCQITFEKKLQSTSENILINIDFVIPCLHGYPGETGEISAFLDLLKIPYLGCNSETSTLCFNKLLTKLILDISEVATTPYIQIKHPLLMSEKETKLATDFLKKHKEVYVKATNQGSSVGCYHITKATELNAAIIDAFKYSPFVIIEKGLRGRELEVAAFEYKNKWHISQPGEIICPSDFYSYEEKYSKDSLTETIIEADNIKPEILSLIKENSLKAIDCLKLRHLARIDFFLTEEGELYLNEPNTFPGHTEISMFPSMMENYGVSYSDYINEIVLSLS